VTAKTEWQANLRERMLQTSLVGALVIHADFWISPSFAMGFDFDATWQLSKQITCEQHDIILDALHAGTGWAWFGGVGTPGSLGNGSNFELLEHAKEALKSEGFALDSTTVCHAWSDLYYIPGHLWPTWSLVARTVGQKFIKAEVLMNEVALPIIFEAASKYGKCRRGTCKSQPVYCWGGCCDETNDPGDLQTNSCGHRMNFTQAPIRQALVDIWQVKSSIHETPAPMPALIERRKEIEKTLSDLKEIEKMLNNFTVLIVSLESSDRRKIREGLTSTMSSCVEVGVSKCQYVTAVNREEAKHETSKREMYVSPAIEPKDDNARWGTVGRFFSHLRVIADLEQKASGGSGDFQSPMIVEDDVVFVPQWQASLMDALLDVPSDWDMLKTCFRGWVREQDRFRRGNTEFYNLSLPVRRTSSQPEGPEHYMSTCGYMINPRSLHKASQALAKKATDHGNGIDNVDFMLAEAGLVTYIMVNPIVRMNDNKVLIGVTDSTQDLK